MGRIGLDEARERFHELREEKDGVSPRELDLIWAGLPTIAAGDILGEWKGQGFETGHALCHLLPASRWYGKRFLSLSEAKPLICYDDQGELYSDTRLGKGEASLWNVEFRGEVTATMIYDGQPVLDHFKQVDDATLMGVMNGKPELVLDHGEHFYFLLERA